uniref:Uncharacterized protein n=1 Tax=Trichogramma kaykai TaxID=54128 RepID=A0ABD2XB39_9HYME
MILARIEDGDFEGEEMIIDVCDLEDIYSCQELIEILKSMRACVHWEIEEDRRNFLLEICPFISAWESRNLDLQTIFLKEEIELLLVDSLSCLRNRDRSSPGEVFIDFVTKTGYKDEPIIAEDGKTLYHRTTPIHCAARSSRSYIVEKLFAIYDSYEVNYTDETGLCLISKWRVNLAVTTSSINFSNLDKIPIVSGVKQATRHCTLLWLQKIGVIIEQLECCWNEALTQL